MTLISSTSGDVANYVKRQFGDESGVQIQDSDIIRWINQGQMEIVSKNLVLRSTSVTLSVVGQDTYTKPDDCLRVTAIKYDTNLLKSMGFDEYQLKFQGTQTPDTSVYWTEYGNSLILAPIPKDDSINITIYYIPEPTDVVSIGDSLSVPDRYFDRLCEFVMSKAYELDEDWQAHQVQRNLFEENLTQLSNEETNTQGPYPVVQDYSYGGYGDW